MDALSFPEIPEKDVSEDWYYSKRREMQEVLPGIFLGPYSVAVKSKLNFLLEKGITHIVCIREDLEANFVKTNFPNNFKYLVINIADKMTENIIGHFPLVKEFLNECQQTNGKVLIHGNTGISRSAALVIAYVMETYGLTYREAFLHVQNKRFCINPNEGFVQQLMEYEPIYLANYQMKQFNSKEPLGHRASVKRSFEPDIEDMQCC
ncbi:serine/threonine/tyrosine-interacting protein A-like [Dendronephthya gigantea]|uniref:serine/threonine/tyrosine-interacting protein A-like n=1 Tax=Dendronephthya gigantea TaxID=151771 RepID=UPI00106D4B1F|nr:serine/threonine/tyrosine-interacting protein A-like [Dendronephthya gigantea]